SGAGKSYTVKLEILRQLMFDCEVIVLDPEHEYEDLCQAVGGEYINFTFSSHAKINPFDLSNLYEEGENELGQKIISIHGLLKVMLGEMTAQQDALLDRALVAAYKAKGITPDPATQTNEPPLMEDVYKALIGMENEAANDVAARLEKYITGSFRGILDQKSNVDITKQLTVFSVKEMEEELRPIAMYIILDFIWTRVKKRLKRRLLIVDEAWYFMKHPDSASFIHSMVKRARKYYLGITTITQDVEDFLHNDYGKAIVSNASIQFLMKQSTASIPVLAETFYLSQGERQLLISADVGEGIFFAGQNHVALRVVASPEEHGLITTNPEEILKRQKQLKQSSGMGVFDPNADQPQQAAAPGVPVLPPSPHRPVESTVPAPVQPVAGGQTTVPSMSPNQNLYSINNYTPPKG
ncbi:ATP-binding protein, partial [Candidatus Woesebacteria bacterium]|nr:ATP-binding protein [Candidatus Woesebacteria bacterium]